MLDIILDTLIDALKILPFLFITFLLMEYFEHKLSNKSKETIKKSGKYGPILGGIIGAFPQCGFSVAATNLFIGRIITLGTLISVYLSTSDEMLPILISEGAKASVIFKILLIKVVIGIIFGIIIDLIFRKTIEVNHIHDICEDDHCDCEHGIFKSSIKHTLKVMIFIILITFVLNTAMEKFGEEALEKLFLKDNIFSSFISSLVGLIPNCGSSVVITELYLNKVITLGSTISGLLTNSGVALILLFKSNHNMKENLKIVSLMYLIGIICGIVIDLIGITI